MSPRLPELEERLGARLESEGAGFALDEEARAEVLAGLRRGLVAASGLAARLSAFPALAWSLVLALEDREAFWPALEGALLGGRPLDFAGRLAAAAAVREAARRWGIEGEGRRALMAQAHGFHALRLRPGTDARRLRCEASWFGPRPSSLTLALWSESRPWAPPLCVALDPAALGRDGDDGEQELVLAAPLVAGGYEAWVRIDALGSAALDREDGPALAAVSIGVDDDLLAAVADEGPPRLALLKALRGGDRKRLRADFAAFAATPGAPALFAEVLRAAGDAPARTAARAASQAALVALRQPACQRPLLDWAASDARRIALLGAHHLPSSALAPADAQAAQGEGWESAMLAFYRGDATEFRARFGALVEAWGERPPAPNEKVMVRLESGGRDYDLAAEVQDETGLKGFLTAGDEEEIEVVMVREDDGGWVLFPELARVRLYRCRCGVLVGDLREEHGHVGSRSSKQGSPITRATPARVVLRRRRAAPKVSRLLDGVLEARRLALASSRRLQESAPDRAALQALLDFDGPRTDPAAYGRAMLEWALPLATADEVWKQRLWTIDRESRGLDEALAELRQRGLGRCPRESLALLEDYQDAYRSGSEKPAAVALEKAVLSAAVNARALARVPSEAVPADLAQAFARLESLIHRVCPALLSWFVTLVELILTEGRNAE